MTDFAEERVLVVPTALLTELGAFHGFTADVGRYLPRLLDPAHLRFLPRGEAEEDPTFKQLIPYAVLRHGGRFFHYRRGKAGTEGRLQGLRSLGVGGHICAEDGCPTTADPYRAGLLRELAEEVGLAGPLAERVVGLINDDRTPVGQVHLGIVHVIDLETPEVGVREAALAGGGFAALGELRAWHADFETWSQFLLEEGCLEAA
jgi:predicted NUDIX family phosphoesterase